jgi:S-disulfanyl-L-cysteine oxidoreductase SoxD
MQGDDLRRAISLEESSMKSVAIGLVLLSALAVFPAHAAGDPVAGEKVFKKCAACHAVGEGAKNKVGPELNSLIGRVAGTAPDYAYSAAMKQAGADGKVWSEETLFTYLQNPRGEVKGTKMAFAGLKKEEEVNDVIAYLATFSPAAAPVEGAPAAQ